MDSIWLRDISVLVMPVHLHWLIGNDLEEWGVEQRPGMCVCVCVQGHATASNGRNCCSPALPWMLKVTWPPAAGGSGTSRTLSGTKGTLSASHALHVKAWAPRQKQLSSSTRAAALLSMIGRHVGSTFGIS